MAPPRRRSHIYIRCLDVVGVSFDTIARCHMQNFMQFNTSKELGCSWCEIQGQRVEKGAGAVTAYPYQLD